MAFTPPLTFTPQSTLDAVNQMLMSIGQAPINTLEVPGISDVSFARLMLHNTSREVQSKGWSFNTEKEFPLSPNMAGEIELPSNALSVDPSDPDAPYIERNRKLYDLKNHTFNIGKEVKVDVRWFFEFEELPQSARAYIAHMAGRIFQASLVGAQVLYQFTKEREIECLVQLEREELKKKDSNIFKANTRANRIYHRRF